MTDKNDGGPAYPLLGVWNGDAWSWDNPGMSLRQYAAIKLRVPDSGLEWLDKMILKAKRDELAGQALAGMVCGAVGVIGKGTELSAYAHGPCNLGIVERAWALADAMIAEGNRP